MRRLPFIFLFLLVSDWALAAVSTPELRQMISQQQFTEAARAGQVMLEQNELDIETRFLTAYAYQMSGQAQRAIDLYQRLIDENPALPEPRNNLAMIYLARGDYDHASQLLVAAIKTHPSYATAYDNLSQVYKGIASEAYRRAVSESSEPARYSHDIKLTAITDLSPDRSDNESEVAGEPSLVNFANQETRLIEQVKSWARAWSEKDIAAYTDFYAGHYRSRFASHAEWVAQRRKRILRPGDIRIEVSDIQIKWRSENRAVIDFKQAFDSARYSDRVVKRLGFNRIGSQWKITEERVLSVL